MNSLEHCLDQWASLLAVEDQSIQSQPGARRIGDEEHPTHLQAISDFKTTVKLMLSTAIAPGVKDDDETRGWCNRLNRLGGLNRLVVYPGADLTVEVQLTLPREPAFSPSAMYLVAAAASQQAVLLQTFLDSGPMGAEKALLADSEDAAESHAALSSRDWLALLREAGETRLGAVGVEEVTASCIRLSLAEETPSVMSTYVEASATSHPVWGPALDRTVHVRGDASPNHLELVSALNRTRLADFTGAGAWSMPRNGEAVHRLTVPLEILDMATELSRDSNESRWLIQWLFDTVQDETAVARHFLKEPSAGLDAICKDASRQLGATDI